MKELYIIMALCISAGYCSSQDINVGIASAFNTTSLLNKNVSNNDDVDYKLTLGGQVGIYMTYDFDTRTGLGMGILFSAHNQKYNVMGSAASVSTRLKYIDIPIVVRGGRMDQGVYGEIGLQPGILVSASEDITSSSPAYMTYAGRNVKSQLNSFDLAGIIGIGGKFDAWTYSSISIGLRFGYSFTDVTKQYSPGDLAAAQEAGSSSYAVLLAHYTGGNKIDYNPTHRAFAGIFITAVRTLN